MKTIRAMFPVLCGAAAIVVFLCTSHHLGVAQASDVVLEQAAPAPDAAPSGGINWAVVLLGVIAGLSAVRTVLAFTAPRTKTPWDDRGLALIDEMIGLLRGGAALRSVPAPETKPRDPQAGHTSNGAMLIITAFAIPVLVLLLGQSLAACGARQRVSNAVSAFLDCESAHLDAGLLGEATSLAKGAMSKWVSGAGTIDPAGLKSELQPLKSDLLRCAAVGGLALLIAPQPAQPGAPASAPLEVDPAQVRGAYASVSADLGWGQVKPVGGAVL